MTRPLTNTLHTVLDRTVVPRYWKIGHGLRHMMWGKDTRDLPRCPGRRWW